MMVYVGFDWIIRDLPKKKQKHALALSPKLLACYDFAKQNVSPPPKKCSGLLAFLRWCLLDAQCL